MGFKPKIVNWDWTEREPDINLVHDTDPDPTGFLMAYEAIQKWPTESLVNLFRWWDIWGKLNNLKTIRDTLRKEWVDIEKKHQIISEEEGWRFLNDKSINDIISNCNILDWEDLLFLAVLYVEYKTREAIRINAINIPK